jgi:C_GCAxxG_C_C family probable redox protein
LKAATGLGGGIGHEGDACGALTGGILSLGLYHRNDPCKRLCIDCVEYYHRFKERFGTTKCKDITGVSFKEGYDIRRFFLKGMKCLTVVYTSIESVFDIIQKSVQRSTSENAWQRRPPLDRHTFPCAGLVLEHLEPQLGVDLAFVRKMSRGFSGGIASQGDICGAFMGAVLALGTLYGTDLRKKRYGQLVKAGLVALKEGSGIFQKEDLHPSFRTSLRVGKLYERFIFQFGSADCVDILGEVSPRKHRGLCEDMARQTAQWTLEFMGTKATDELFCS